MIVARCNTSGCIRASAVDSFSHRYRTIVPEDCVGDIAGQPRRDNLRATSTCRISATVLSWRDARRKSNA